MKRKFKKISGTRGGALALLLTLAGAAFPQQTHAIGFLTWYAQDVAIRYASSTATLTPAQEATAQAINDAAYYSEARLFPLSVVGQTFIDGSFNPFEEALPGGTLTLTFNYLDPNTFLVGSGPPVTSVLYQAVEDPSHPGNLTTIGSSSDSGSDFAITWASSGYEPMIEAIPLDAGGHPIVILGAEGGNSAVGLDGVLYTPDSSRTSLLLGLGMAGLLGLRRWSRVATR